MHEGRLTALEWTRIAIGLIARGVMWVCVLFIVGNAVAQSIHDGAIFLAIIMAAFFPLTFFIWPFVAEAGAQAWPLADGTSFIPFLVTAIVAYPISTHIGGMRNI